MIPHPLPVLALTDGGKNVKAAFEPVVEAVGDLDRLMRGVICGINTIIDPLRAVNREVAMQFDHGMSRFDQFGSVYLNFVVLLCADERCRTNED
jgi:hypothetical protein